MKTILILSGGMDSATLLYHLVRAGHEVRCLSIDYGQRHRRELKAAQELAARLGVEHRVADLTSLRPFLAGSSQTDDIEVPEGHYAEENMKLTVVPNRNMLLLAVAIAWAISTKSDSVAYGAHAGDHAIYPDCRPDFIKIMGLAALLCDWRKIDILAPFQDKTKGDIAKRGFELGVPYELTWTCYKGGETPCGKCGACQERAEAFAFAGGKDPLLG